MRRKSALSCRNNKRYSAREVNMRYGSFVPWVTRSSISTPMYASMRVSTQRIALLHLQCRVDTSDQPLRRCFFITGGAH